MNVDFLHNQIIRDTISPKFIESFNENLLPILSLKYGEYLQCIQFYEDHLTDGFRIGGIFYYPLTIVVSGVAKTVWISWQVSNYRIYDNLNPFTYKGQELLNFSFPDSVPSELIAKIEGKPIYSSAESLQVILSAKTDDKTFLAGKYSQGFIDLMASEITVAIENELCITGLAGSGVVLEMNFAPGTYMEHVNENTTYRRLRIKARACSARDFWIKWKRLDGNGRYTVSDNVDRSEIEFSIAEDVPGKMKEREYRYLTTESLEKFQASMSRKNVTEWREMMRRVIRRGEVDKVERIVITKPIAEEEYVGVGAENAVTISASADRGDDDITERLNALLGNTESTAVSEPEVTEEPINSDLDAMLRGVIGNAEPFSQPSASDAVADVAEENEMAQAPENTVTETEEASPVTEPREITESTVEEPPVSNVSETESEMEARIRREVEARVAAEMEELRRKNREAEAMRIKIEEQKRREEIEKERLAEAARLAVMDKEKREADLRAEQERDRLEAERKAAEQERIAEERRREEEARAEKERIERERAEMAARAAESQAETSEEAKTVKYVSKTVTLIFRRTTVDSTVTAKVREIILATIKYLHKEDVYLRIKATVSDTSTLLLEFSEIPENEQQLVIDIIQVLGKSNIGIAKALLE